MHDEQLAAQTDVASQFNPIISSYTNNPAMLSSLNNTITNILTHQLALGTLPNQLTSNVTSFPPTNVPQQQRGNENQGPFGGTSIVENVKRFLIQGAQVQHTAISGPLEGQPQDSVPSAASLQRSSWPTPLQGNNQSLSVNPPRNGSDIRFGTAQSMVLTDATVGGTTTDASNSSRGQDELMQFGTNTAADLDYRDRKRRRSPSPP